MPEPINRQILLKRDPEKLLSLPREDAANFVLAHGDAMQAYRSVTAFGASQPLVWKNSYTGLTGLYFADTDPRVDASFISALGVATIGERLGKSVDRKVRKFLQDRAGEKAAEFRKHWKETFDAEGREKWWTAYLEQNARPPE